MIVFEGIDGSGKSTQVRWLAEWLEGRGIQVHRTFEPTDYRIGSLLRRILTGKESADAATVAALFAADRLDHIPHPEYGMQAILARGECVICDRYLFSSYAYNSAETGLDYVADANRLARETLRADLTLYLEQTPADALARILAKRSATDLYEKEETLAGVQARYEAAFERFGKGEHLVRIAAGKESDVVSQQVREAVEQILDA